LTSAGDKGDNVPHNSMKRKATNDFFETHPVFSLGEAAKSLAPPGGKAGTVERLKYHLEVGRLKLVAREIYAVVPAGIPASSFQPDPLLVASAIRPDGVFAFHSALELLGAAHSTWSLHTLFDEAPRRPLTLDGFTIKFLKHPKAFQSQEIRHVGTRRIERRGKWLRSTGPERTLVEGFRNPKYLGGLEELVVSASGFAVLDLNLIEQILAAYDVRKLWSAVGWFLERFQRTFHVPDETLHRFETRRPRSPQYLIRHQRGGKLSERWNIILPEELRNIGGPDAP